MGKNLKGKELGKGLGQRKDGLYYARCMSQTGQRQEKCFAKLSDAKNWRKEQEYLRLNPEFSPVVITPLTEQPENGMTVDEWFELWNKDMLVGLAANTIRNYRERYERNAKGILGHLQLTEVKQMHCKMVFNRMVGHYANSTVRQAYITLGTMFKAARENGLIERHPMDGIRLDMQIKSG